MNNSNTHNIQTQRALRTSFPSPRPMEKAIRYVFFALNRRTAMKRHAVLHKPKSGQFTSPRLSLSSYGTTTASN